MMRNRYPHTSDPDTLAAQRGAALAKSIAAVAVVFTIVSLASLSVRDAPRADSRRAGETVVLHAAASAVDLTAPQAPPVAGDELHQPSDFDPNAVDDYRATAQH
jgi:hypothetical protein